MPLESIILFPLESVRVIGSSVPSASFTLVEIPCCVASASVNLITSVREVVSQLSTSEKCTDLKIKEIHIQLLMFPASAAEIFGTHTPSLPEVSTPLNSNVHLWGIPQQQVEEHKVSNIHVLSGVIMCVCVC